MNVALAVVLRLDAETAGFIDAMTECLPERLTCNPNRSYPAHITLATFSDAVDAADLDAALATATGREALQVTLVGIGISPGDPSSLWLAPAPTTDLLIRHATFLRALADLPCHPEYEIGTWMPQVVLRRTHLPADAVEVLVANWHGPITGWLDSLDLVQLNPVRTLSRRPLRI